MNNLCKRIKIKLNCLPPKDKAICERLYASRDFESMIEIVKSDIIKRKKRTDLPEGEIELVGSDMESLLADLIEYNSYNEPEEYYDEL